MIFHRILHLHQPFARIADNDNEDALRAARGFAIGNIVSLAMWVIIIMSVYQLVK